jgi:hypothetical protein
MITSGTQSFQASGGDTSGTFSFTVPAGNRLAIETITLQIYQNTTGILAPVVSTVADGRAATHALSLSYHPVDPHRSWATHSVRLYADPSSTVTITIAVGTIQIGEFTASVSGYLVPTA